MSEHLINTEYSFSPGALTVSSNNYPQDDGPFCSCYNFFENLHDEKLVLDSALRILSIIGKPNTGNNIVHCLKVMLSCSDDNISNDIIRCTLEVITYNLSVESGKKLSVQ
ncbi:TPA: hypothetical protein ACS61N_004480 [Klebsiella oxytoca]